MADTCAEEKEEKKRERETCGNSYMSVRRIDVNRDSELSTKSQQSVSEEKLSTFDQSKSPNELSSEFEKLFFFKLHSRTNFNQFI